jgi:hypothetical protein
MEHGEIKNLKVKNELYVMTYLKISSYLSAHVLIAKTSLEHG